MSARPLRMVLRERFGCGYPPARFRRSAPTDHLIVVNAGHPPPLWYRSDRQTWQLLEEPPPDTLATETEGNVSNLPLGIIEPTPYVQFSVALQPGDLVVLYTDALIETRGPQGEMLGANGLLELVRSLDTLDFEGLSGAIRDALGALRSGASPEDDLTLLVLHRNAANPPRLSLVERLRVLGRMMGIDRLEPRL
jgi:serine phosphatase RsbU (regulator of sigma subunit)